MVATIMNGKVKMQKYYAGDMFVIQPMVPHNLFLKKGSVSHAIKFGGVPDWNASCELDEYLKGRNGNE